MMDLEVGGYPYKIFLDYLGKDQACVVVFLGQHWKSHASQGCAW